MPKWGGDCEESTMVGSQRAHQNGALESGREVPLPPPTQGTCAKSRWGSGGSRRGWSAKQGRRAFPEGGSGPPWAVSRKDGVREGHESRMGPLGLATGKLEGTSASRAGQERGQ